MPGFNLLAVVVLLTVAVAGWDRAALGAAPHRMEQGAAGRSVPDAFVPVSSEDELLPVPKELRRAPGTFTVRPSTRIIVGNAATAADMFAARELNEELRARYGVTLDVVREREVSRSSGHIVLGEPERHMLLGRLLRRARIAVTKASPGPEGYVLRVTPDQIIVA